jgi:hypothetical protein
LPQGQILVALLRRLAHVEGLLVMTGMEL